MINRLTGIVLTVTTVFAALVEWYGGDALDFPAGSGSLSSSRW